MGSERQGRGAARNRAQEGLILEWSSPHFAPDSISLYLDLWQGMAPGGVLIHCRDSSGPAYLPLWGILRSQEEQARPEVEDWLGWPGLAAVWTASPEVVGGVEWGLQEA